MLRAYQHMSSVIEHDLTCRTIALTHCTTYMAGHRLAATGQHAVACLSSSASCVCCAAVSAAMIYNLTIVQI